MPLPLPTALSPSKVSSFKHCGLAFRYKSIDFEKVANTPATVKGTMVHRALELMFQRPPEERTYDNASLDLDMALQEAVEDPLNEVLLEEILSEKYVKDTIRLLKKYFEVEDPTVIRPVGLELKVEAEVGGVLVRGIIDRLDLDDNGELVVVDYKTGRVPGERFEQDALQGMHFYAYLCESIFGRRPAAVKLMYLTNGTTITNIPTDQSIRGLERKTAAVWKSIERACEREAFKPNPSRLCDWCDFQAYCPVFGGEILPPPPIEEV